MENGSLLRPSPDRLYGDTLSREGRATGPDGPAGMRITEVAQEIKYCLRSLELGEEKK